MQNVKFNKKIRFSLVYPFYKTSANRTQDIPLGVCQIKSKIHELGHVGRVVDLNFLDGKIKQDLLRNSAVLKLFILKQKTEAEGQLSRIITRFHLLGSDIICFSVFSFDQLLVSLALAKILKQEGKIIVFGGSFCEQNASLMNDFKFVDFIIQGTGEIGAASLIKVLEGDFNPDDIRNIIYRAPDGKIIDAPVETDIKKMSLPDFSDLDLNNYRDEQGNLEIPYCIGIGCVNRCHYCSSHRNCRPAYKDARQIGQDIRALKERYNVTYFFLICNLFNVSEEYMAEVSAALEPLNITWATCITYQNITSETLKAMKNAGCVKLLIGVESGSQRLLDMMNKKINLESVHVLEDIRRVGIRNRINIILDFPGETEQDALETAFFLRDHQASIDGVHFILFQLTKKSFIFDHQEQFDLQMVQSEKGFFEKYIYSHLYRIGPDRRLKAASLEDYRFSHYFKPFMERYRQVQGRTSTRTEQIKRIMFYYHHFGGYGHGMRVYSICKALHAIGKFKIFVINSGPPQPELGIEKYAKVYHLPPVIASDSLFSGLHADGDLQTVFKKRNALLNVITEKFNPDLAVIEHFPFGRMSLKDEIVGLIHGLRERNCRVYSSVRDMILSQGQPQYFDLFDGIFIHEDPDFHNGANLPKNAIMTGRVHPYDPEVYDQPKDRRDDFGQKSEKVIVVSIGGGLDGHELLTKLIQIKTKIDAVHPCRLFIFTGGSYPDAQYDSLKKKLPDNCEVSRFKENLMDNISTADLFISMGGYNSFNSHLLTRTPSMVFPRLSDAEQQIRAQHYGFKAYNYQKISEKELLDTICSKLSLAQEKKPSVDMNGAQRTACFIMKAARLRSAKIRLTTRCDLNCSMCSWRKRDDQLDEKTVCSLLDDLAMFSVKNVTFTGGEPTVYPGLERVMAYAKKKGLRVSLATNGFNQKAVATVLKNLDNAEISLDSHLEYLNDKIRGREGAYVATLGTIQWLSENGIRPHINVTVRPDNYKDIHKIITMLSGQISSISFTLVDATMNRMKELEFSLDQLKDYYFQEVIHILREASESGISVRITPFHDQFDGMRSRDILNEILMDMEKYKNCVNEIFQPPAGNCQRAHEYIRINANGEVSPCCYLDDSPGLFGNIYTTPLHAIVMNDAWFCHTLTAVPGQGKCVVCQQGYARYKDICLSKV